MKGGISCCIVIQLLWRRCRRGKKKKGTFENAWTRVQSNKPIHVWKLKRKDGIVCSFVWNMWSAYELQILFFFSSKINIINIVDESFSIVFFCHVSERKLRLYLCSILTTLHPYSLPLLFLHSHLFLRTILEAIQIVVNIGKQLLKWAKRSQYAGKPCKQVRFWKKKKVELNCLHENILDNTL